MEQTERLTNGRVIRITPDCSFGTDATLLAAFAGVSNNDHVCDLGTGCGILPLLFPGQPTVDAVDCWPPAVSLARRSVADNGLSDRITVWEESWDALTLPAGTYDKVICNPPYFPENGSRTSASPARRLARQECGNTLECVTTAAARLLKPGGRFILCHRPERLADVLETLRRFSLEPKRLQWAYEDNRHAPFLFLCDAVSGGRPLLDVLPPLLIKEEDRCPER